MSYSAERIRVGNRGLYYARVKRRIRRVQLAYYNIYYYNAAITVVIIIIVMSCLYIVLWAYCIDRYNI